jgi:outer membrane protein OmpA-like peptidoglycan-associated protein
MIRSTIFASLLAASAIAAGPAVAQDRWDWQDDGPPGRGYDIVGPGVRLLYPELRDSRRGRAWVVRNFNLHHDGFITLPEARHADEVFDQIAGGDRAGFDWDRHGPRVAVAPVGPGPGGWDHEGMRAYHFRQGSEGAVFDLQDVLFQTGSAALRPGAEARLRPLAGFLRANPDVRLKIDGNTDSVGSAESNLQLSRDRASSVAAALEAMGVDPGRFRLAGHGEAMPVASNGNAAGRQLNRRVEVTLIGQRAATFG